MSDTIKVLDETAAPAWDRYVAACPEATFFHRAAWARVIRRGFGHTPHFLYAERDGEIRGVLPLVHINSALFGNRLVSTAFCVGGSPAVDDEAALIALDAAAAGLMTELKAEYVEYRDPPRTRPDWALRDGLYATFDRPIEADEEANLKQIPRKQRAVVRKALKTEGLSDRVERDIDDFYALYSLGVRNLGTPVFGKRYVAALLDAFGEDCDILTVSHQGRPISSVLSFYFRDRVMPYYTGADPAARRLGAADLMYWRLMRQAVARGYTTFDFGRSKVGTGPFSFKKNWGFEPRPTVLAFRLREPGPLPDVNPNNPKYRLMINTWKRLPLPIANLIGPPIARHLG